MSDDLTNEQEDYILEERREHQAELSEGLFSSWLSDNKSDLKQEFKNDLVRADKEHLKFTEDELCEIYEDDFIRFCDEEFKFWKENNYR